MEQPPMQKLKLTSIESGTEMDDNHFTQPMPFQCGLPGIVENVENSRQGNTPSMIMSQNSDRPSLYDNTSNQSITVSTRTSRWYHSIKNKISTPLAMANQNTIIDFSLEPINIPHSPQNMYNGGPQISRPNTIIRGSDATSTQSYASPLTMGRKRNTKAMKLLGIEPSPASTSNNSSVTRTNRGPMNIPRYAPPTTPMPSLFSHLIVKRTRFPAARPPPADSDMFDDEFDEDLEEEDDMDGIVIVTDDVSVNVNDDNKNTPIDTMKSDENGDKDVSEMRDEFNDEEMVDIQAKHDTEKGMIRVSAKEPQLMIHRISTEIGTPIMIKDRTTKKEKEQKGKEENGTIESNIRKRTNTNSYHSNARSSPSKSNKSPKSPFSKKKNDKEIALLSDDEDVTVTTPLQDTMFDIASDTSSPIKLMKLAQHNPKLSALKISMDDIHVDNNKNNTFHHESSSESPEEPQCENIDIQDTMSNPGDINVMQMKQPKMHSVRTRSVSDFNNRVPSDINTRPLPPNPPASKPKGNRFGAWVRSIGTPLSKKGKPTPTIRDLSMPRHRSRSEINHEQQITNNTSTIVDRKSSAPITKSSTFNDDGNPDVVGIFKVLAYHGFYSNRQVLSAQQLRDYNMKY